MLQVRSGSQKQFKARDARTRSSIVSIASCNATATGPAKAFTNSGCNRRVAHEPPWRAFFRFANRKHAEILGLERTLFEQGGARHVIANSHMVQKEIIREFAYPADKITVVYNGLPDLHFKRNLKIAMKCGVSGV